MSNGSLDISSLLPADSEPYLIAYSFRYNTARIGDAVTYLDKYMFTPAEGVETRVRKVRFPIPMARVELRLFKGRRHFTRGGTKFIEVQKRLYQEGVNEFWHLIQDPAWTGFDKGPERLRKIVAAWPTRAAAALVNKGETILSWKGGKNFLDTNIPSSPMAKNGGRLYRTWYPATPLTHDNVQILIAEQSDRRDMEGDPIGGSPDTLFCSSALYPLALSIAKDALIDSTKISNPVLKWNLQVEKWPHLAPTRWGLLDSSLMDEYNLFNLVKGAEELEVLDRQSYLYQSEKKMGVSIDVDLGIALARNEAISVARTT